MRSAAAKLGAIYRKNGTDQKSAMTQAWAEVQKAYENGTSIIIDDVEAVITKNEKLASSLEDVDGKGYKKLAGNANDASNSMVHDLDRVERKTASLAAGIRKVGTVFKTVGRGLGIVTTAVSAAWSAVGLTSVKYIASIEQLEMSFATMTGSAAKAADIMARLRKLGAETPFETEDLAATTQLLMQYGMNADTAIDRMTMLGDIAQGNADKMNRIATAYGQMSSAGKVQLEDVKQMIEAGFNPLLEISERTGESMGSLYDRISKGTLAVDEITQAMQSATSEGGKFFRSMEKQSETINGMFSTIKDEAQELGGIVFQPLADGLKSTIFPEARNIIASLKEGFKAGGLDGMMNEISMQIPRLTSAAVDGASKMFAAVNKKLPQLTKSLLSSVPNLLRSAVELAPQIGDALFGVAGNAVETLIGQLPRLVPSLMMGIGKMFLSATTGVMNMVDGVFKGIGDALKDLGVLGMTAEDVFGQILADYDREHVEKLKAMIDVEPEVTVNKANVELTSLYDEIETTLTDGLADTPEIVENLKKKVTDYYNTQIENINAWREEALANLDSTLPQAEYESAVAEINRQADQMVLGLRNASNATIDFIDTNAGKATKSVENNLGALESIYNTAVDYNDKIAILTGESRDKMEQQRKLVAEGQVQDEKTIINALASNAQEFETTIQEAEQKKQSALDAALEADAQGTAKYAEEEAKILKEYASAIQRAEEEYTQTAAEMWQGISEALSPQMLESLEEAGMLESLQQKLQGIMNAIVDAFATPGVSADKETIQTFVTNALGSLDFTDADYTAIAEKMGIDEIDPAKIQQILIDKMTQAVWDEKKGWGSDFLMGLSDTITNDLEPQIAEALGKVDVESGPLADILQASIEQGFFDGIEGIDLTTTEGKLQAVLGAFGKEGVGDGIAQDLKTELANADFTQEGKDAAAGYAEGWTSDDPFDMPAVVDVAKEDLADAQQSGSPAKAFNPLGQDAAAGYGEGMTQYSFGADAATVARNALAALSPRLQLAGRQSGAFFAQGLASGIESGRSQVISAAIRIAQAAVSAVRSALGINSPSKVAIELGGYFGQGFEQGITASMRAAVRSAETIAGSINLRPRLDGGEISSAFTGAAQGWAEAESMRPIQLIARGRVIAETLAPDNARASNSYNRRIALGVGKK